LRPGTASRTAEYAAGFRALESVTRPLGSRLFVDPLAVHFLRPKLRRLVRLASLPCVGKIVRWRVDQSAPGAMTSCIARTRLIDDLLLRALGQGVTQVVLLGAGFDCRAYRLPELARCRVIEIDHPSTQTVKKEKLQQILGALPRHVTYLAVDLTTQDLRSCLKQVDLDARERVFVLWEGVTHYLGEPAVPDTLKALSDFVAPESLLLFTYIHRGALTGDAKFEGANIPRERVSAAGEPWIWGMAPGQMPAYLAEHGWKLLEDTGTEEYRTRYWGERGRRMRGFTFYRAALAAVQKEAGSAGAV